MPSPIPICYRPGEQLTRCPGRRLIYHSSLWHFNAPIFRLFRVEQLPSFDGPTPPPPLACFSTALSTSLARHYALYRVTLKYRGSRARPREIEYFKLLVRGQTMKLGDGRVSSIKRASFTTVRSV